VCALIGFRRYETAENQGEGNKKAPQTFQSKTPRQPSPRTAKPQMHGNELLILGKRHFGNGNSPVVKQSGRKYSRQRPTFGELRLQGPGLALVASDPDFAVGSCDTAVLWVGKFDGRHVSSEHSRR
jgi:hypothetical protein